MIEPHPEKKGKVGALPSLGCMETRDVPAVFVRLESPRLRTALPYASLIKLDLALNQEQLDLAFATHHVTVRGKNLQSIFDALSQAQATRIKVAETKFAVNAMLMSSTPFVSDIRVEPFDPVDRRRR